MLYNFTPQLMPSQHYPFPEHSINGYAETAMLKVGDSWLVSFLILSVTCDMEMNQGDDGLRVHSTNRPPSFSLVLTWKFNLHWHNVTTYCVCVIQRPFSIVLIRVKNNIKYKKRRGLFPFWPTYYILISKRRKRNKREATCPEVGSSTFSPFFFLLYYIDVHDSVFISICMYITE